MIITALKALKRTSLAGKILTVFFAFAATLLSIATPLMIENEGAINGFFKIQTSETYEVAGDAARNENYKTDYGSIAELRQKTHSVSRKAQEEGSVLLMNKSVGGKPALPLSVANEKKLSFYSISSIDPVWGGTGSGQAYVTGTNSYTSETYPLATSKPTYKKSFDALGFTVNEDLWGWYENAITLQTSNRSRYGRFNLGNIGGQPQMSVNGEAWTDIDTPAKEASADAAFFVLARIGGEAADRKILDYDETTLGNLNMKSYLQLSTKEKGILDQLKLLRSNGTFKKLILIVNSSNQLELDWLTQTNEYGFDAALWVGGIGQDGHDAIADLIAGKANPSGKLSVQYWNNHALNPVQANFGSFDFRSGANNGVMSSTAEGNYNYYVAYQEGMYLGYRYAETRYEDKVLGTVGTGDFDYGKVVAYPFGYGSSYTSFAYSNFNAVRGTTRSQPLLRPRYQNGDKTAAVLLDGEGNIAKAGAFVPYVQKTPYSVSLRVTNTGSAAGKETVQIYLQRPYTQYDKNNHIEKPAVELVGFHKTGVLQPGAYEDVTIVVDEKYFAAFDAYGEGTYVVTPGAYYLTAAANAHEAVNNILKAKGRTTGIDSLFGNGGDGALARRFSDPVPVTPGKEVNADKYRYSDVTGLEITNLFDYVDPNLDKNARTESDPANYNTINYITRANWADTVKLIDRSVAIGSQTCQVRLVRTDAWNTIQQSTRQSAYPAGVPATAERPMPNFGKPNSEKTEEEKTNTITLAMMATVPDEKTGKLVYLYDYDDPKWDEFLDQLTTADYIRMTSDGYRSTREADTVGKPQTVEHNGPVGFIHKYNAAINANGKRSKQIVPFSEMGVTKQADGTYLPNRLIPDTTENMYGADPTLDPDRDMFPTAFPSNIVLASTYNRELVEELGVMIGEDALWGGYSGIYGTGANIIRSPHAGRAFEYFSEDGFLTGVIVGRWSRGAQSKGCYVYNKHFALNEQELSREGISTFVNEQTFREIYLRAFEIPISGEIILGEEYDAKCLMGAFNRVGVDYSVHSKPLFTDWLRGEAGLSGHTVSDWWNSGKDYMNIGYSLLGGNSLPDGMQSGSTTNTTRYMPGGSHENVEIVWKMRESIKRQMYTVADSNAMGGYSQNTRVRSIPVTWPVTLKGFMVAAWVVFGVCAAAYVATTAVLTVNKIKNDPA